MKHRKYIALKGAPIQRGDQPAVILGTGGFRV